MALPSVPMPQQDCAVFRSGRNVAVGRYVALGPGQARHDAVVTKDYL